MQTKFQWGLLSSISHTITWLLTWFFFPIPGFTSVHSSSTVPYSEMYKSFFQLIYCESPYRMSVTEEYAGTMFFWSSNALQSSSWCLSFFLLSAAVHAICCVVSSHSLFALTEEDMCCAQPEDCIGPYEKNCFTQLIFTNIYIANY